MEQSRQIEAPKDQVQRLAARLFHRKWQPQILSLLKEQPARLHYLERHLPGISRKVLVQNLRQLEAERLILRFDRSTKVRHVEYCLAPDAHGIKDAIELAEQWRISNERREL